MKHEDIYNDQALRYHRLVQREDAQGNLLKALHEIATWEGKSVVEIGAGTGRLSHMVAPFVSRLQAFDRAPAMLDLARQRAADAGWDHLSFAVAENHHLPLSLEPACADIAMGGWTVCYSVTWSEEEEDWRPRVDAILEQLYRLLKPGGTCILIETLGTGYTEPTPPEHLVEYYRWLEAERGFQKTWVRTDYAFADVDEAQELVRFFFGDARAQQVLDSPHLPECTGIWWRKKPRRSAPSPPHRTSSR